MNMKHPTNKWKLVQRSVDAYSNVSMQMSVLVSHLKWSNSNISMHKVIGSD